MSMPKAQRLEHVELRVPDVGEAVGFYRDVIGMTELAREEGAVYLGFGLDENYDVAVSEGSGLGHFAIRVDDEDELGEYERRLAEHGVETTRADGREPGQERAVRFELPSGQTIELVTVRDKRYPNPATPAYPRRQGILPLDCDHIGIIAPDVKALCGFFVDVLGFKLTEYSEPEQDFWGIGFVRKGNFHHDISIVPGGETMHHFAVAVSSFDHMKLACDMLAGEGHRIELGPSRHPSGTNLFIYVRLPGGHRWEFSTEMALIDEDAPPIRCHGLADTLDAWSDAHLRLPEGFFVGS
jgi:catechol 2,3-dioxygenase